MDSLTSLTKHSSKGASMDEMEPVPESSQVSAQVWVFNGTNALPSGVFSSRVLAEEWIHNHRLTGILTQYPVDVGVYDWVQSQSVWAPKTDSQRSPLFVAQFTSAYLEHHHYTDGKSDDE